MTCRNVKHEKCVSASMKYCNLENVCNIMEKYGIILNEKGYKLTLSHYVNTHTLTQGNLPKC